jgi:hypothetical protein
MQRARGRSPRDAKAAADLYRPVDDPVNGISDVRVSARRFVARVVSLIQRPRALPDQKTTRLRVLLAHVTQLRPIPYYCQPKINTGSLATASGVVIALLFEQDA